MKLVISASPHISSGATTRKIMGDVLIALCPALIAAIVIFGWRALLVTAVCAAACVFFEWGFEKLCHKESTIGDLSAVVTGVILAYNLPVSIPLWQAVFGCLVAIVAVKQLFGGIGKNFVNPALAGRAFLLGSYASVMTTWIDPAQSKAPLFGGTVDAVTAATPLAYMKSGDLAGLLENYQISDLFLGNCGGSMGEISALMILIGGVYLIWRKVINWQTPVGYLATVAVLTLLFPKAGASNVEWMLCSLFSGGVMLGAFFMATDYATSPVTKKGQLIFGIGCGLFTVFIRYFGSYNEGVCYSIMVMNLFVALIDKSVKPARFGVVKSNKKEAAAK